MPSRKGRTSSQGQPQVSVYSFPYPRGILEAEVGEWHSALSGKLPPPVMLTPETLRYMAERSHVFQAILRRRSMQIAQFAKRPLFDGDTGFEVVLREYDREMTPAEKSEARKIEDILLRTGAIWNPMRQDNLRTALQKLLYNTLVYDAMVVEPVFDRRGRLLEWYVLDGGTVFRTNPDVYQPATEVGKRVAPVSYIQVLDERVRAEWNAAELIYAVRNPSPELTRYGYGISELELLIVPITLEIEILAWAKSFLQQAAAFSGLILLESRGAQAPTVIPFGSGQTAEDLVRYLQQMASGAQNAGHLVVFEAPRNSQAKYYEPDIRNREMPFAGLYELVQNIICSYYGISPTELEIVRGTMRKGSSFINQDSKRTELRYSRLNGLVYLLSVIGEVLDTLISYINPEFCVMWRGVDHTSEEERHNLEAAMVKSGRLTFNDLRRAGNKPPYNEWWGDLPANPIVLQIEAARRGLSLGGRRVNDAQPAKPGVSGEPGSRVAGEPPTPNAE